MINTTQILGTDSISASRMVTNDNFNILRDEINAIETYVNPDSGVIDNINSIKTLELRVGTTGSYKLEVTSTSFNINTDLNLSSATSLTTIKGKVAHDSFILLDESSYLGTVTIDPKVGKRAYTIKHTSGSDFTIFVDSSYIGQDVEFFVEQKGVGNIFIDNGTGVIFTLPGAAGKISLDDIGSTLKLSFINDSVNNGSYYVISGNTYSFV